MNESVWQKDINIRERLSFSGNIKTDVLIIGGGLAGVLTARLLKENNVNLLF